MSNQIFRSVQWPGWLAILLTANNASAEKPVEGVPQTEAFNEMWRAVEIMGDRSANQFPFIKARGRCHSQTFSVNGEGRAENNWQNRRFRLGLNYV